MRVAIEHARMLKIIRPYRSATVRHVALVTTLKTFASFASAERAASTAIG